jgi:hypothetical protein
MDIPDTARVQHPITLSEIEALTVLGALILLVAVKNEDERELRIASKVVDVVTELVGPRDVQAITVKMRTLLDARKASSDNSEIEALMRSIRRF